ncbi:MAG: hypothetical protein ACLFNU_05075 [Bacteroidales bacterium]
MQNPLVFIFQICRLSFLLGVVFIFITNKSFGQDTLTENLTGKEINSARFYKYIIAPDYDLYNSSINTRTTGKLLHDAFTRGIGPKIRNKTIRSISEGAWSFTTIFYTMLMSHEFGHMLRTRQAGGKFSIDKVSFPVIYGNMDLPPEHTLEENILSVAGGFEVNYLTVKDIQLDLYRHQKLYNDELSLSFANRLMYPIYLSLIAPVNPEEPNTWINTMGDPVHWIKPIWMRSGNDVLLPDGTVNSELVGFYKQSALASVLWNFLDLNFYNEVAALFGENLQGKEAKYLIGNKRDGWGYGTHFNTSVLGAELHLINYIRLKEQLYTVQFRYGFPFNNKGAGIGAYDLLNNQNKFNLDVMVDVWDQEFYNTGFAFTINSKYKFLKQFEAILQAGYKSEGYLIGRTMDQGFTGCLGLQYIIN